MKIVRIIALVIVVFCVAAAGCAPGSKHYAVSVVDYLYPTTKDPVEAPSIPVMALPLRVGIAFVPAAAIDKAGAPYRQAAFGFALTELKKMELMQEVANHFKKHPFVKDMELIPSAYLTPGGSFANLNQIRTMYGVDVIALLYI
jgi:rhombotail lipoprotein